MIRVVNDVATHRSTISHASMSTASRLSCQRSRAQSARSSVQRCPETRHHGKSSVASTTHVSRRSGLGPRDYGSEIRSVQRDRRHGYGVPAQADDVSSASAQSHVRRVKRARSLRSRPCESLFSSSSRHIPGTSRAKRSYVRLSSDRIESTFRPGTGAEKHL